MNDQKKRIEDDVVYQNILRIERHTKKIKLYHIITILRLIIGFFLIGIGINHFPPQYDSSFWWELRQSTEFKQQITRARRENQEGFAWLIISAGLIIIFQRSKNN